MTNSVLAYICVLLAHQFSCSPAVRPEAAEFVRVSGSGQLWRQHSTNANDILGGKVNPDNITSLGSKVNPDNLTSLGSKVDPDKITSLDRVDTEKLGIKSNGHYTFMAVLTSFITSVVMFFGGIVFVQAVSSKLPLIYSYNAMSGVLASSRSAMSGVRDNGLVLASLQLQKKEVTGILGLDNVLAIMFSEFGIKMMVCVGVPSLISAPLNYVYGEESSDTLSRFALENLRVGHPLHWMHCVLVWLIVWISQYLIIEAQLTFVEMRVQWLKTMPPPRSTTVMVENIPSQHRSDSELRQYFGNLFGHEFVESATVVKHTETLKRLCASWEQDHTYFQEALHEWQQRDRDPDKRPRFTPSGQDYDVDTMEHYKATMITTENEIKEERRRIMEASRNAGDAVCSAAGFVTFNARHKAATATLANCKPDIEEMSTQIPPAPTDVIYEDLMLETQIFRQTIGWSLILILFLSFLPIVFFVASLSSLSSLRRHVRFVETFCEQHPDWQAPLEGALASSVLTLSNSFVPTLLQLIFNAFFVMKASSWGQMHLHVAYFWFQMLFIVLASAIGNSLLTTAERVAKNPYSIFQILATTLPSATHFFVNFVLIQIGTLGLDITRYLPLMKFLVFRTFTSEERAKELSEPEDQDYDGLGSRSARVCIILVIGLIYGTLCPLLTVPVLIYFCANRIVKGYLIIFAETRKHDSGGVFWVQMLDHIFQSLFIYVFLMAGVLHCRGGSIAGTAHFTQGVLVAPALVFLYSRYRYFSSIQWKHLSFEAISSLDAETTKRPHLRRQRSSWHTPIDGKCQMTYEQPELCADYSFSEDLVEELAEEGSSCPAIGVLRCDYQSEAPSGDTWQCGSRGYRMLYRVVRDMTWEMLDSDGMTADVERKLVDAVKFLEMEGVCCIIADCGIMAPFQRVVQRLASVPVLTSSLIQCPLVCAAFAKDEQILIITAWEARSLQRDRVFSTTCFNLDLTRFVVAEFSSLSGYNHTLQGDEHSQIASDLRTMVKEWILRYPKVRAVILECIEATVFADALKLEIDIPVFDAVTISDFYTAAADEKLDVIADGPEEDDSINCLGCLDIEGLQKDDFPINSRCEVKHQCVQGLTLAMCRSGELPAEVLSNFKTAISALEANGVAAITAKFPLLLHLQRSARELCNVPVFVSPMVMCPALQTYIGTDGLILVMCANSSDFERSKDSSLDELGIANQADQLMVVGVQRLPGADNIEIGIPAEHELFEPKLIELAWKIVKERPCIRVVLLEALALARYADILRQTLHVPVVDAASLCKFYRSGRRCAST